MGFPRLHFMITAMAPVCTVKKMETARTDIQSITEQCFSAQNFFAKIADFDAEEDKYMAISVNYRGDIKAKKANAAVQWMKTNKKVCFVEWCPTGFKVGLNEEPAAAVEADEIASFEKNVVMMANNTAISRVFSERISKKYDMMYSQRAFVHWYVGEGMEEGEFAEAIYEICQKHLDIKRPSYDTLNRMFAKVVSSMTASLRFEGELNVDLNEFQTNLVPFPRLHFMITAMAPITTQKKKDTTNNEIRPITELCFSPNNFFAKIADFDAEEDKYMAVSVNYRGSVKAKEANATVQWLKTNKKVTFVEWVPTGFKVGLNEVPAASVGDHDETAQFDRNVVMIGNNTAVSRVFSERISKKYDMMYSQRAFVHWYVGEGMDEGEFAEARE